MKILVKSSVASILKWWLEILWYMTWAAAVIIAVIFGHAIISGDAVGERLDVPVLFDLQPGFYDLASDRLDVSGARITDATGTLRFESSNAPLMAFYLWIATAVLAVLLVVFQQLRKIFRSLTDGDVFTPANAFRIRIIGLFVIFGEIAATLLEFLAQHYIRARFETTGLVLRADFAADLSTIFGGLVVLAIAEVFRTGAKIKEDQDLTI